MYHPAKRLLVLICLILSASILPAALFAQPDPPPQVVVVTASKEPQDPLKLTVPVLVSHPDGESSVDEWLATLPGFSLSQLSPGQASLRAATFGDSGFGRIQFLIDGVAQNEPDMNASTLNGVPLAAIDHSETLLTPGSTLYGDQAVAGAVNFVTLVPQKPTLKVSATGDLRGGNAESVLWGTPVGQGGLVAAVQQTQVRPERARSNADSWNIWLKGWLPTASDQKLTLTGAFVWNADQLPGSLTLSQYQSDPNKATNQGDQTTQAKQQFTGSWELTRDLLRATVPFSASMEERTSDTLSLAYYTDTNIVQSAFEPRGEWTLNQVAGGDLTVAAEVGGEYQRLEYNRYTSAAKTSLAVNAVLQRLRSASRVSLQQNWGDEWFLNAQGRFEGTVTTAHSDQDSIINNSQFFSPLVFSTGVSWVPQEGSQLALNIGQTFRYPFLDEMVSYTGYGSDYFSTSLQPETGWDVTFTARSQWGLLHGMTTGRLLRMNNEIAYNSIASANVNESASWHYSWTTSVSTDPVLLPLGAGTGRLSLNDTLERAVFSEGANEGKVLPLVPLQTVNGEASWSPFPFLEAKTRSAWTSSFYQGSDQANTQPEVPWRWRTDVFFIVRQPQGEGWSLTIFIKNVTDDRTPDTVYYSTYTGNSGWYPSDGRSLGAAIHWSW